MDHMEELFAQGDEHGENERIEEIGEDNTVEFDVKATSSLELITLYTNFNMMWTYVKKV